MVPPTASGIDPLLIAVDAATAPASVSLLRGEGIEATLSAPEDQRTDAWLLSAIEDCLLSTDHCLEMVQGFAVTVGPGAFTGIRVGIASCMGLAAPLDLPVAGILTLESLAEIGRLSNPWVAPCLDARRGQVYGAIYHLESPPVLPLAPLWGPTACGPEEFAENLTRAPQPPLVIGSGLRCWDENPDFDWRKTTESLAAPTGRLAARTWSSSGPAAWPRPEPVYLRPADVRPARNPLLSEG